jgi:hypothetical protein
MRDREPDDKADGLLRIGNLILVSRQEWLRRVEALRECHEYGAVVDLAESAIR